MSRTPVAVATTVVALAVGLVAPSPAAAAAAAAPTDVAVSWQDASPVGWFDQDAPPEHEVLVTWTGPSDVVYRVCPDGGPAYLCVTSAPDHPTSAVLGVGNIPESPATRISVVATADGQPDSAPALSPVFDSLRADFPAMLEVRPTSTGSLVLSWAHRVVTVDPNPGDPLDVEPPVDPVFRVGLVDADWTIWRPKTTATTVTLDAPRGGLFAVTEVNEWNIRRTRALEPPVVNVWMTDVTPVVPRKAAYRSTITVRGVVKANAYWCYGMPPNCASDDGPGFDYATRPQAGRLVLLQARRTSSSAWVTLDSAYSDANGAFAFRTRSVGTRQLRTLAAPTAAPDAPRAADASPAVTAVSYQRLSAARLSSTRAAAGSRVTARVSVGATCVSRVSLQRRTTTGSWTTVTRARLVSGRASASLTVRRGTTDYRWRIGACTAPNGRHVAGDTSSTLRLRGR